MSEPQDGREEELREEARKRMESMPGETALGHADPEAGGEGDPKDYKGNQDRS